MSFSFITAKCQGGHLQILYAVAALNVADVLGEEGPQTAHQLAQTLGMPFSTTELLLLQTLIACVEQRESQNAI